MGSLIFLALIIILVSGLIAYVGDLVGRKMGRKRLSLLGLRPRHTAIVISVGVGMLIALLTLTTLLIINKSIREAFLTLDQVKADLRTQTQELQKTERDLQSAKGDFALASRDLSSTRQQLTGSQKKLHYSMGQLRGKQRELALTNSNLRKIKVTLHLKQGEINNYNSRLSNEASNKYARMQKNNLAWKYIASQMVFSPLSFAHGQEILSGLIPGTGGDAVRRAYLAKFFAAAERVVRQRCTYLDKDFPALLFLAGNKDDLNYIDNKAAIDKLLARIDKLAAKEGVVIHLASINNVPSDGFAFVAVNSIDLAPNVPVYGTGDTVAMVEMDVDANTPAAEILGNLADTLLRVKLPAALRAKHMLPITRRFDPAHPDKVPEAYMPAVSWNELTAAVEKAKGYRGKIQLIARSHADVTMYGPLRIDLDVEQAP